MKNKHISILIATMIFLAFTSLAIPVLADSENVSTEWIVPVDTEIAVSYPTGKGEIEFDNTGSGATFSDIRATDQTPSTAGLRVLNNGNSALQIEGRWSESWPTNVTHVNMSVGDNTNGTQLLYTSGNRGTEQTWVASLGIGGQQDFWFWSSGAFVPSGTSTANLQVNSSSV